MSGGEAASLAARFRRLIATDGPIGVMQYMGEANAHYYSSRDPLGAGGDFITAPEISQMFGELLGLCLADLWHRAGAPRPVHYVELGPGRGTLARDALRAMGKAGLSPQVHFVEGSETLIRAQQAAVPGARFHGDLAGLPQDGAILLVANEFFDALPVRQMVRTGQGWRERMVALEGDRFVCVAGDRPMDAAVPDVWSGAPEGSILEACPGAAAIMREIARRLAAQGGAALIVDYGYDTPRLGSSLQAVRAHAKVDPFADPGAADLTAHVDFAALAQAARAAGARWLGTVSQGAYLREVGINERADALARAAPEKAEELRIAVERLVGSQQMGTLFKVMGLAAPDWPDAAGFSGGTAPQ